MEIDMDAESEKVKQEINRISQQLAILDQQIAAFQAQRQALFNNGLKKSGELDLLQRLGKEELKKEVPP